MRITTLLLGAALLMAQAAFGDTITYQATLDPTAGSTGTGTATVTVDTVANTMDVSITFSGLSSGTTAAHINCCTATAGTGTAGVASQLPTFSGFPLGVTSGTYVGFFDLTLASSYNPAFVTANGGTTASAEAALLAGLAADEAYVNIHTTIYPAGEISGFLVPVSAPEPATILLVAIGLAGLVLCRRRFGIARTPGRGGSV